MNHSHEGQLVAYQPSTHSFPAAFVARHNPLPDQEQKELANP